MTTATPTPTLVCHRIVLSATTIQEVDGLPLVTIDRRDVGRVIIDRGIVAENWLLLVIVAIIFVTIGVAGVCILARGQGFSKTGGLALSGLLIGPATLALALRRGVVLVVETVRRTRKLGFGGAVTTDELLRFTTAARSLGWEIVMP